MAVKQRNVRRKQRRSPQGRYDQQFIEPVDKPDAQTIAELKRDNQSSGSDSGSSTSQRTPLKQKSAPAQQRPRKLGERIHHRLGTVGSKILLGLIAAVVFVVLAVAVWIGVLALALRAVPDLALMLGTASGVLGTEQESFIDAVALQWGLPVVFITGLLLVATCVVIRFIWRGYLALLRRIAEALLLKDSVSVQ